MPRYDNRVEGMNDIVLIEWVDSCGHERWEFLDEIEPMPPHVCHTIGFLMDDKEEYKTIASSLSTSQVLGRLTIPSVCIRSITVLKSCEIAEPDIQCRGETN